MLTTLLKDCKECSMISATLQQLQKKQLDQSRKLYQNKIFGLRKGVDKRNVFKMLMYREILTNMMLNKHYFEGEDISTELVVSKVKTLINK